jgi:hypothetical protein
LIVADPPDAWIDAGFEVTDGASEIGSVRVRLEGPERGRGIVECSMRGTTTEMPDGLPIVRSTSPQRQGRTTPHPNGVITLDHLVAFTPRLERTIAALEEGGLELRRLREEPTPAGAPRQAFFRLAEVILEVIERPPGSREDRDPDVPARFWGLAFLVEDLAVAADCLGGKLGEPRAAVQPGRRIATLRSSAGIGPGVAFMTPPPQR